MLSITESLQLRSDFLADIREWFAAKHYLEVHSPNLVATPGTEVHLQYFKVLDPHRNPRFLRSSPELSLKRYLSKGVEALFELAPSFRRGDQGTWHSPEFLMLEWYKRGLSYSGMISETIELVCFLSEGLARRKRATNVLKYDEFRILTLGEAFEEFVGFPLIDGDPYLQVKARQAGILSCLEGAGDFETNFFKILLERIEPALAKLGPCILKDYPASMAILSKVEGQVAQRFELYLNGVELCNAFCEELSPKLNLDRIKQANRQRQGLDYDVPAIPEAFLEDLKAAVFREQVYSGNALGVERLLACLTEANFRELNPFLMLEDI